MIEKIMRAVKSNNKKRGRNITIGAVVGMLLSCSTVMGADVVGLEIKESGGSITFTPGIDETYTENTWDEKSATYTNNSGISAENNSTGKAYGLKLSGDLSNLSFINNGSITATKDSSGYGIYNEDGSVGSITNTGKIFGSYYAIYNSNSRSGSTSSITSLINTGSISAGMRGIYNDDLSSTGEIINSGTISAGTGIDNEDSGSIGNLKNKGIIYGQSTAISNYSSSETISNANNYGLLVSSNTYQNVVKNVTIVDSSASATTNEIKNYGLAFIADSNKYIGGGRAALAKQILILIIIIILEKYIRM